MLKIGDFSKLSRISIRMLRHYDELGLLVPKSTDDVALGITLNQVYDKDFIYGIGEGRKR